MCRSALCRPVLSGLLRPEPNRQAPQRVALAMLGFACAWLRSRAKERAIAPLPGPVPRGRTREDEPAQGRTAFRGGKEYDDGR